MAKRVDQATVPHITITGIDDPLLQATARLAQNVADTAKRPRRPVDPSYHRLTREALERTYGWLEQHAQKKATPLDKLKPEELELLTGPEAAVRLQALDRELAEAALSTAPAPLLLAMKVENIVNPDVRACATAITDCYGEANTEGVLNIGELMAAWQELVRSQEPGFEPSKAFRKASADPSFTKANVNALRIYMMLGLGGLYNHGTLEAHGVKCHRVYKLSLLDEVELPKDKAWKDLSKSEQHAVLNANITAYERQFAKTGYDRIYARGADNSLYIGLRDEGVLKELSPNANMIFHDPSKTFNLGAIRQSATVMRVVDVNSTTREATIGFLSRTAAGWGQSLNNLFRDVSEKPVTAITAISDNMKPDPKASPAFVAATTNGFGPIFAAAGLAGIAAAIPSTQSIVSILGFGLVGFVGAATSLSVWSMWRTGKDIGPILDAIGHVVNRADIRSDEV